VESINDIRRRIDSVDDEVLRLLNERMRLVQAIGEIKRHQGLAVSDPVREGEIVRRLAEANGGPLPDTAIGEIFREIFSAARCLEKVSATAYLGPEATFTHLAALKHFGRSEAMVPSGSIREVFLAVEKGTCSKGVVPVENSTEGSVADTLDLLMDTPLSVIDEIYLEIHHHLLSRERDLAAVRTVFSHPQALAQCQEWLREEAAAANVVEVPSTAEAARRAMATPGSAAIASEAAAAVYNLEIIARRIEDRFDNLTRFLVIGRDEPQPGGRDKTSLILSLKDRVGALGEILAPVARAGLNLSRIESRPSKRKAWDYLFFMDLEGHKLDPKVAGVLEALRHECPFFKVLGSYPDRKGETPAGRKRR
jgi:chorismate mutase/prephenate dehydratase